MRVLRRGCAGGEVVSHGQRLGKFCGQVGRHETAGRGKDSQEVEPGGARGAGSGWTGALVGETVTEFFYHLYMSLVHTARGIYIRWYHSYGWLLYNDGLGGHLLYILVSIFTSM